MASIDPASRKLSADRWNLAESSTRFSILERRTVVRGPKIATLGIRRPRFRAALMGARANQSTALPTSPRWRNGSRPAGDTVVGGTRSRIEQCARIGAVTRRPSCEPDTRPPFTTRAAEGLVKFHLIGFHGFPRVPRLIPSFPIQPWKHRVYTSIEPVVRPSIRESLIDVDTSERAPATFA